MVSSCIKHKRFYTTKEINVYDSPDLRNLVRTIPKNTLIQYDRLVIRNSQNLAQIKEGYKELYFEYKNNTVKCRECIVKEKGLDALDMDKDQLKGLKIKVKNKELKDKNQELEKSQIIQQNGETVILLRNNHAQKNKLLSVHINDTRLNFQLLTLEPYTKFYAFDDDFIEKGNTIVLLNNKKKVVFNEVGMYKVVDDGLAKFHHALMVVLALALLFGGIAGIAISTGYVVIVGIIMIPVAGIVSAIITTPIISLIRYIGRYF